MQNPLKQVDRRSLTILLGAFTFITLLTVILIIVFGTMRNRRDAMAVSERLQRDHQALANSTSFGLEDYYRDSRDPDIGIVYPARSPQSSWTREEVEEYWIDPSDAGLADLSSRNDELIFNELGIGGSGD